MQGLSVVAVAGEVKVKVKVKFDAVCTVHHPTSHLVYAGTIRLAVVWL